ncbi:MAG TPA: fused MFS/spermidine synthase [Rhizomicrobium sp.]|nr:fused MFS/spermidine synthase [Rhizomicrobium sp.]
MNRRPAHTDPFVIEQNNATGSVSYWQNADNQSAADRHGVSLADYIHAMYGFIRQAKCRDVLMIGCGGGTLATMLCRTGVRVAIVDTNAASFEIARRYFHMPQDIACHVADGAAFLRRTKARYDAIVLDAYDDAAIPKQFLRKSFFDLAQSRMAKRGAIFLMNIIVSDDADRTPDRIVRLMGRTWRHTRLLDCDGWENRNAVALAGAVRALRRPRLLLPPARGARKLAADLKALEFRALRA